VHQKSAYVTASRTQVCAEFDVVCFFVAVKWWFWCIAHCFHLWHL